MNLSTVRFSDIGLSNLEIPTFEDQIKMAEFKSGVEFETAFYDIFWRNGNLYLIGPYMPLTRISQIIFLIRVNKKMINSYEHEVSATKNYTSIRISFKKFDDLFLEIAGLSFTIENRCNNIGKKVFYTMQKDNHINHIKEWICINTKIHEPDSFLIYDNLSTSYNVEYLRAELLRVHPNVYVYSLPFKFGANIDGTDNYAYLQYAGLKHAIYSNFDNSGIFINMDIDEVYTHDNLFETFMKSDCSVLTIEGEWLFPDRIFKKDAELKFSDHQFVENTACLPKYIIDISDFSFSTEFYLHRVENIKNIKKHSKKFFHFRGITNNWKYNRSVQKKFDPSKHSILPISELSKLSA
jgi:hypothetical protein